MSTRAYAGHLGCDRPRARQDDPGFAVLDHERLAFKRSVLVERHIGRAAFENGQLGDDEPDGPHQRDRHAVFRPDAEGSQMTGEAIGRSIEFGIGQARVAVHNSDRLRRPGRLRLEELVHGLVARIVRFGRIPFDEHAMALRLAEQRRRSIGCVSSAAIARAAGRGNPRDVRWFRRRTAPWHIRACPRCVCRPPQAQREIEDGVCARLADRRRGQAREVDRRFLVVLPGEHRLEYRRMREAARRLDDLHHLLERQILMRLRLEHLGLDAAQQLGDRGVAGKSSRSARLLTKNPISGSISTRLRFAAAAPITKSSCPDNRARSAAQPASTVMKSVVPWRKLRALSDAVRRSSNAMGTVEPA